MVRPFTAFNFVVLIDLSKVEGVKTLACNAAFSECDGLEMTLEPKTIREGGRNTGPVHLAGPISYGQLSLKRGMTQGFDLWKWFDKVAGPGAAVSAQPQPSSCAPAISATKSCSSCGDVSAGEVEGARAERKGRSCRH